MTNQFGLQETFEAADTDTKPIAYYQLLAVWEKESSNTNDKPKTDCNGVIYLLLYNDVRGPTDPN